MNRDDIIKMAQEAELLRSGEGWTEPYRWGANEIEHFAELVAEAEREACAKLCEQMQDWPEDATPYDCAKAIRARGE
jgi:hypothetical protein